MSIALLIDFGSTYTKLRAVDLDAAALIASAQGPSTVTTDVTLGLDGALAELESRMGGLPKFRYRLASSSAAGGLRMITVGLVPDLTAKAARLAALGAGAKLAGTFSFELTEGDVDDIVDAAPDIVLLSGGTDGGNRKVIAHNATTAGGKRPRLSRRSCRQSQRRRMLSPGICSKAGKKCVTTENVMPRHLELNIEPARQAIRQLFIEHIVHAKGIDRARARFDAVLMPTPGGGAARGSMPGRRCRRRTGTRAADGGGHRRLHHRCAFDLRRAAQSQRRRLSRPAGAPRQTHRGGRSGHAAHSPERRDRGRAGRVAWTRPG